jgi:hypothetical protein
MASGTLAAPGTKYGPCEGACEHRDCSHARQMAAVVCRICEQPIGFEKMFYDEHLHGKLCVDLVHAFCAEGEIKRKYQKV